MFENEQWKVIKDFPHYMISSHGRVKSTDRAEATARKVSISDKGFPIITLYGADSKTRYLRQINKLVAQEFLAEPYYSNETAVWHKDGDLTNCHYENLQWDTRARVMEWNEMHRTHEPKFNTPKVKNNRTGKIYENAFECGMAEGMLESAIVYRVERAARHDQDDNARYRYIYE